MTRTRRPDRVATYWTLAQLAARLGVTTSALRLRIATGTLAATKVGAAWVVAPDEATRAIMGRRSHERVTAEEIARVGGP